MWRTILIGTGGKADGEKCRQGVVAIFAIAGEDAKLRQNRKIAEAVLHLRLVVSEVRRKVDADFDTVDGNSGEAFAAAVVFGCGSVWVALPGDVVTDLLF